MGILVYRDREANRDLVGRIDYDTGESAATFTYDPAYLARAGAAGELGISELLPLDGTPYAASEMGPFFRGLLPEGEVYGNLAELYQVSRSDYLALLEQMGCESIGALTFVSEGVDPAEYEPRYEPVGREEIEAMIADPARMATIVASSTRLSLAGAQSKIAWLLPEGLRADRATRGDWLVPRGTAPSTHIIKVSRRGEEGIALNELACSLLSTACGIRTAQVCKLSEVPGAIAIERYDRPRATIGENEAVIRLHQEDFCQALGFAPFLKYQPRSVEANYPAMMASLVESTSANPQADKIELAKRLVFCYAVGNTDAHLKNFSLLYNRKWTARRLAPMYDVTCIPLTGYSTAMPFEIGEHREIEDIDARDITILAADLDVGMDSFDAAVRTVIDTLEAPSIGSLDATTEETVARVLENSRPRLQVLRRFLG